MPVNKPAAPDSEHQTKFCIEKYCIIHVLTEPKNIAKMRHRMDLCVVEYQWETRTISTLIKIHSFIILHNNTF